MQTSLTGLPGFVSVVFIENRSGGTQSHLRPCLRPCSLPEYIRSDPHVQTHQRRSCAIGFSVAVPLLSQIHRDIFGTIIPQSGARSGMRFFL